MLIEIKPKDWNTLIEQSACLNYSGKTFMALLRNPPLKNHEYAAVYFTPTTVLVSTKLS